MSEPAYNPPPELTDEALVEAHFERMRRDEQATAFHEAGHAVAAYLELGSVGDVEVVPDLNSAGRTFGDSLDALERAAARRDGHRVDVAVRQRIEALVLVLLAGARAEDRALADGLATLKPEPAPAEPFNPDREHWRRRLTDLALRTARLEAGVPSPKTDDEQVDELLELLARDAGEALLYRHLLEYRAAWLVHDEPAWSCMRSVAEALEASPVLTGADVGAIIRRGMESAAAAAE
jgi:hypothetical protein